MAEKTLPLSSIRLDGGTQMRVKLDDATVAEYAERLNDLPPSIVFWDGSSHWLADGFTRYFAHSKAGKERMRCEVRPGTQRDAILFAAGANSSHGLRRSPADKRRAVEALLKDEEWAKWSDVKIANTCAVSVELVASARKSYIPKTDSMTPATPQKRTFLHPKTGKPTTMNTGNIGKKSTPKTDAPAREIKPDTSPKPTSETLVDDAGQVVPERLKPVFEATAGVWVEMESSRVAVVRAVNKLKTEPSGEHLANSGIDAHLKNVMHALDASRPHAVCPHCKGEGCKGSIGCKGLGWLTAQQYQRVPSELRKGAA